VRSLLIALLLTSAVVAEEEETATPAVAEPSCVTHCHGKEAEAYRLDIHRDSLACIDCHGGDPTAQRDKLRSHDPAKGFVGTPARRTIPELCGGCHSDPVRMAFRDIATDQLAHYRVSKHGRAVLDRGDDRAAVCSDCHGAHGIRPRSDPNALTAAENLPAMCGSCHSDPELMAAFGLPSDTVSIFLTSIHGRTLEAGETRGSPTCIDCHGKHGATAPRFGSVVQVCSHCHANTGREYERGAHHRSEEMRCDSCHEEEGQEFRRYACTACHGVHGIQAPGEEIYTGEGPGSCFHCHREPDAAHALVETIIGKRDDLLTVMRETRDSVEAAKRRGLFLDHEEIYLRESNRALIALGPLSHSLESDRISAHLEQGMRRQDRTRDKIEKQQVVLRDRRLVLLVAAFLFLLLAALLLIKLRALRRLS